MFEGHVPKGLRVQIPPSAYFFLLIFLVFFLGIFLRLSDREVSRRTPDEIIYTTYARVLAHEGTRGTTIAASEYHKNPKLQTLPPPTRIGYLYLLALAMKITGCENADCCAWVSFGFSVLTLFVLIAIGLRFFNAWITLIALLFLALSPFELVIAKRVWQDGLMTLVSALLMGVAAQIIRCPKKIAYYFLYSLLGLYAILVKESGVVILGLCTFWILAVFFKDKLHKESLKVVLISLASIFGALLILSSVTGGTVGLFQIFKDLKQTLPQNSYAAQYQNDPWYSLIEALWLAGPLVFIFSLVGMAKKSSAGFVFVIVSFLAIVSIPAYFKNLRYLSPIYIPYYLMAATGVWTITDFLSARLKGLKKQIALAVVVLLILTAAGMDYLNFRRIFIEKKSEDLVLASFQRYDNRVVGLANVS